MSGINSHILLTRKVMHREKTTYFPILMSVRVAFKTILLNSELVHLTSFKVQVGISDKRI